MNSLSQVHQIFYNTLFEGIGQDEYIEVRRPGTKGVFHKSVHELLTYINPPTADLYHGVFTRGSKSSKKDACMYSNFIWIDIDWHDVSQDIISEYKMKATNVIREDYLLKNFTFIVDSGRGLHVYFKLPFRVTVQDGEKFLNNLVDYCSGVEMIRNSVDHKVCNADRILRMPYTINSRAKRVCEIVDANETELPPDFMGMLRHGLDHNKKVKSSVKLAATLSGMEHLLDSTKNHKCPFHQHGTEDTNPSWHYYDETDSCFCFKCGSKAGTDGQSFLRNIGRNDLVSNVQAELDFYEAPQFNLTSEGKMIQITKEGKQQVVCDFYSSSILTSVSNLFGKRAYIQLPEQKAIRIDDLPSNKQLKHRYLEHGHHFVVNYKQSEFSEMLMRYMVLSTKTHGKVIHQYGINDEDFYFNGKLYPVDTEEKIVSFPDRNVHSIDDSYDINKFLRCLINDNNYTHVIALLWAVASTCKDVIIKRANLFPILVATGQKNSGKSKLGEMVTSMFGINTPDTLNSTDFAMIDLFTKRGSYPLHLDEYARKFKEVEQEERLKNCAVNFPFIEKRGTSDLLTTEYSICACPLITGEKNLKDSGLLSRSILINVTRNNHPTEEYFKEWYDDVKNNRLKSFLHLVLGKYASMREYFSEHLDTYVRTNLIKQFPIVTLHFLIDYGFIEPGLIDENKISTLIADTENSKMSINSGEYGDIFDELSVFQYEPNMPQMVSGQIDMTFGFGEDFVFVSPMDFYRFFVQNNTKGRNTYINSSVFKQALMGSPDFRGTTGGRVRWKGKLTEMYAMAVSDINRDFFTNVLKYKLGEDNKMADDLIEDIYLSGKQQMVYVRERGDIDELM